MTIVDEVRRVRLRALMARGLRNWRDVWDAYAADAVPPPLLFRNGLTLHHGEGDAPVFLFFEIFANRCYRRLVKLPSRGTIVDVGANIGAFALDCAFERPGVRVAAYEPNPRAFRTLEKNVDANGLGDRVHLFNEAVGAEDGTLRIWNGGPSLAAGAFVPPAGRCGAIDVSAVAAATVIARAGHVGLLKIDAEGAEVDILADSRDLAHVTAIVGEYHEDLVPNCLARVRASVETAGFRFRVARDRRSGPLFSAERQ